MSRTRRPRAGRPFPSLSGSVWSTKQEEPDQRQPELSRVRHGSIVDQHLGFGLTAGELEQIPKSNRVVRKETRAVAKRGAATNFAMLGGVTGDLDGTRVLGSIEARKDERYRKREIAWPEQRSVEVRVERGKFLGAGLL
jgi:hypothetical protein